MPYMTGLDFKGYENREKKLKNELEAAHKEIEKLKNNIQPAPFFEETNFFLLRQIDKMQARIHELENKESDETEGKGGNER